MPSRDSDEENDDNGGLWKFLSAIAAFYAAEKAYLGYRAFMKKHAILNTPTTSIDDLNKKIKIGQPPVYVKTKGLVTPDENKAFVTQLASPQMYCVKRVYKKMGYWPTLPGFSREFGWVKEKETEKIPYHLESERESKLYLQGWENEPEPQEVYASAKITGDFIPSFLARIFAIRYAYKERISESIIAAEAPVFVLGMAEKNKFGELTVSPPPFFQSEVLVTTPGIVTIGDESEIVRQLDTEAKRYGKQCAVFSTIAASLFVFSLWSK